MGHHRDSRAKMLPTVQVRTIPVRVTVRSSALPNRPSHDPIWIRIRNLESSRRNKTRRLMSAFLASTLTVSVLPAQSPRRAVDCNLAERRYDNPFADHSGWSMRRYEWHAFYATSSIIAAEGIHRATHLPRWASAVTATIALGILPHIRSGLMLKRYPINAKDWSFDLFT